MEPPDPVRAHTRIATPWLCPEIRLHLVTDKDPLWRATEADLARLGLADPYWAFCWPGGQAMARYLLDTPALVRGRRVLSVGAGGGVEAIAAAMAGACQVVAADIDPLAARAASLNAAENGVTLELSVSDPLASDPVGIEVILAADVCYDESMAQRLLAWSRRQAENGALVLLSDPGRGFLQTTSLKALAELRAPADIEPGGAHLVPVTIWRVDPLY